MGLNISDIASKCSDLDIIKIDMNRIISIEDIDKRIQGALATSVSVCIINIVLFLN